MNAEFASCMTDAEAWEWEPARDGNRDRVIYRMARRHYSAKKNPHPKIAQFVGPGEKMVLVTRNHAAIFAWRNFIDDSGQEGVNCCIFRREGPPCINSAHNHCASNLILRAEAWAWLRWPGERLYTYVDPTEITSANPGYCFKRAGWRFCGKSKEGLHILEKVPS